MQIINPLHVDIECIGRRKCSNFFHFFFRNSNFHCYISSCECKKVVSDILDEIEFFADIDSTGLKTHFEP